MNKAIKVLSVMTGVCLVASSASAHAFLDHATPGVGATVSASPSELALAFTQNVEASLSSVRVAAVGGASVVTSKPTKDPADPAMLHVKLGRALMPGTYVVTWHVVSVDTHPTSGSYKFTVAP